MQLLSIDSATFGTLRINEPLKLDPGVNICVAPNQAGKSTLLTLLEWMLYGVPPHGRKRSQTDVDRWRPWDGGTPQAAITLLPGHPDWPKMVRITVNFEDFTPHATNAETLEELGSGKLFTVDKSGTWDIGKQLTGLGREAFRLSLLAPQEEMDNVLRDTELRRLLTADLAELVEDPERATLDAALSGLEKPVFTMGELSKGPVQMGTLLREAQTHWQLSAGNLENQQERFKQLETMLLQLETAEGDLGEMNTQLARQENQLSQMGLAAAHWRYRQIEGMLAQAADWEARLDQDKWLADFPAGLQRDVDTWSADRRHLREQFAAAEAQTREADALKLRAPYVEQVHVDGEEDVVRLQERLANVRNDIRTSEEKHQQAQSHLREIDDYLERNSGISSQADRLPALSEQYSALAAAAKDWHSANNLVREYGEGRDAKERQRLEELEKTIKPYRGCIPQTADYLQWTAELAQTRIELEGKRDELDAAAQATGTSLIYGAVAAAVIAILLGAFGGMLFQAAWVGWVFGILLLALAVWLGMGGARRSRAAAMARVELEKAVTPKLEEVARREEKRDALAQRIRQEYALSESTWDNLVEVLPEYQRLRLSLEQYSQALRDRDGARDRRDEAWEHTRELCEDAPVEVDDGWLTTRIRGLESLREQTRRRLDEHSKLKDIEIALDKLRHDDADILRRLAVDLEPLGLGNKLKQDVDAAVKQFQTMVTDTRRYVELRRNAGEMSRLKVLRRELLDKLARLMSPIGLGGVAADDPDTALREFETRHDEAQRYAQFADRLKDAREQARHLNIERADYQQLWEATAAETRRTLEASVTDEAGYDSLIARRRSAADALDEQRRLQDQKRVQVERLHQALARDEDVRDEREQAALREYTTSTQLAQVRRWQRALQLLKVTFEDLQHDLASNLAPRLTDELQAILAAAPVAGVSGAGLSGQLELQLDLSGAPAGLAAADRIERLSVGARRQLALALRIAVAKAVGDERRLVMLLDEPLAELDDARAVDCLRFIGTLAKEQQFVLTTCHTVHQQWLAEQTGIEAQVISLG